MKHLVFSLTLFVFLTVSSALAQQPPATGACGEPDVQICDPLLNLLPGTFHATP